MYLIRTFIREAIIRQLQSSSTLKVKVKAEKPVPIPLHELPVIAISLDKARIIDDWSALSASGELLEMVEQPIVVKIIATATTGLEEKLEELAAFTTKNLAQDETLGGLLKTLRIEEEADVNVSVEGEQPIGVLTMRWVGLYRRPALQLDSIYH